MPLDGTFTSLLRRKVGRQLINSLKFPFSYFMSAVKSLVAKCNYQINFAIQISVFPLLNPYCVYLSRCLGRRKALMCIVDKLKRVPSFPSQPLFPPLHSTHNTTTHYLVSNTCSFYCKILASRIKITTHKISLWAIATLLRLSKYIKEMFEPHPLIYHRLL